MLTRIITSLLARLFSVLPQGLVDSLFTGILNYLPLFILSRLPFSYGIYAKCYPGKNDGVVIDCGAHIGNCAILFSRLVGPKGLVVCLEPFEASYQVLLERIDRFNLGNVVAINKGLWNEAGVFSLETFEETISCRLKGEQAKPIPNDNEVKIECTTIDTLVKELKLTKIDFIKMDIEGAEIEALQGARKTLAELRPQVAIASYHHREGRPTASTVEKILNGSRYDCRTFFPPHLTTCGKPR
ncbi:MAG: FkbM family methyltransferase [Desulfobacterales bacterium]|nr:FkbM family methyltransferase [Desulfobacterales bacterium]